MLAYTGIQHLPLADQSFYLLCAVKDWISYYPPKEGFSPCRQIGKHDQGYLVFAKVKILFERLFSHSLTQGETQTGAGLDVPQGGRCICLSQPTFVFITGSRRLRNKTTAGISTLTTSATGHASMSISIARVFTLNCSLFLSHTSHQGIGSSLCKADVFQRLIQHLGSLYRLNGAQKGV